MSPSVVAGVVLLVLFWAWIGVFFARVRPSIMNAVGRRLRVKVEESTSFVDAGTYGVKGDRASLPKTGVVLLADFAVLFLGTVGVAALLFVPAFLVAESGTLLPLEARLTGRGAALRVVDVVAMSPAAGRATLALDVENTGRETLVACIGGVDGYTARNGYLHGSSPAPTRCCGSADQVSPRHPGARSSARSANHTAATATIASEPAPSA